VSGLTDAVAIGTSTNHACALTASGHVECWGSNVRGTLGDETQDPHSTPALVHGPLPGQILGSVTALGVGAGHSCAVDAAGAVYCWGMNEFGQLGNGDGTDRLIATPVSTPTGFRFVDVAVGRYHVCALTRNGMVYCWGANDHDQLGNGTGLPSAVPVLVADIWHARTIGAGANHTCVVLSILSRRTSHCWGASDGSYGESLPQPDLTSLERASGGAHHTCALDQSGRVYCWGSNINHQLGTPDAVGSTTTSCPVRDPDPSHCISPPRLMASGVAVLATGDTTTCVTTSHGQIRCWGDNLSGLAGSGAPQDSSSFFVDSATPRLADLPGVGTARVP
jgi:alpha-tubulin suppressor-like RCC1 family protein